ncbi:MAG: alanine--tRNA ligase-related protein, partial [Candidatus Subteraquimicrobiales bacterium]|nr:alanine--tRNA ligase-related protein [Candidatus Subteraquimicrobiales bacterium]
LKEVYGEILDQFGKSEFVGYFNDSVEAKILAIVQGEAVTPHAGSGDMVEIVLQKTPFYAEMGGQVGDKGVILTETGKIEIQDTQTPLSDVIVHVGKVIEGVTQIGQLATAYVDKEKRVATCKNHTATHILHWALGKVLGKHVKQAGSYVDDKRLRFDFVHTQALTEDELSKVEKLANERIFENSPVKFYETSFISAKESGAVALFGEKYDEQVRVLEVGDFSKELCGGTHVSRTGEIGLFKIVNEESVGASLRRIEACTSFRALDFIEQEEQVLNKLSCLLKTGHGELEQAVEGLIAKSQEKDKELQLLQGQLIKSQVAGILSEAKEVDGAKVVLST